MVARRPELLLASDGLRIIQIRNLNLRRGRSDIIVGVMASWERAIQKGKGVDGSGTIASGREATSVRSDVVQMDWVDMGYDLWPIRPMGFRH